MDCGECKEYALLLLYGKKTGKVWVRRGQVRVQTNFFP
jgi:hypothetical protein